MENALLIIGFVVVGFILFCIYFILKQLEFVLVSVNLYRKMVRRQEAMVKLLLDIRDNTKVYEVPRGGEADSNEEAEPDEDADEERTGDGFCFHCGEELPEAGSTRCPKCGKAL